MGRETVGGGGKRVPRPATTGRIGPRGIGGFNRGSLRWAAAIAVAGLVLTLLVAGGIVYWRLGHAVTELERSQYGRLAAETRLRLERLVSRDRGRLREAGFSDELYALIERGPAPPDSFVHPSFTEWFPRLYGDQFVGLFALDGRPLYVWSAGENDLATVAVTNPLLRMLDNREPTAGLVRRGEELYWVAGVPVLPTNYGDTSRAIGAYLVVAQPFGADALANLTGGQPFQVRLRAIPSSKTAFRADVQTIAKGDSAIVRFAVADIFAQQNTLVELVTSRSEFQTVSRTFGLIAVLSALLLAGFAALAWWAARRWVIGPATQVSAALQPVHQGQLPGLLGTPAPVTEWIGLTAAINRLIANVRGSHERLDRLGGTVRDGAWEHDFITGEWTFSARFRALLDQTAADLPATQQSFEQLIHPDDREIALVTIQASAGSGRPLDLEARLRRRAGDYGSYRLQAEVQADSAGTPIRLVGRVIDLAPERLAADALTETRTELERSRRTRGRMLLHVGSDFAPHHPREGARVTTLGQALTDGLPPTVTAPFDLCALIEDAASGAGVSPAILPAPGLVTRVAGDAGLVRLALSELIANAARADHDRIVVRLDRSGAAVRFTVMDRGAPLTARDQQRIITPLETGEPPADATECGLGLLLVREVVRHLGGTAGVAFPADGGTSVWFAVDLAPLETPAEPVEEPAGLDQELNWSGPASDRTFDPPPEPVVEFTPRPSGPVSLIADATVVIDLDGPEPIQRDAAADEAPAILAQLQAEGQTAVLARQLVTAFLNEAPIHLAELMGAVKAGTADAATSRLAALEAMAKLIGARELAVRARAAVEAIESVPVHQATRPVDAVRHELERVRRLLGAFAPATTAGATRPPIDPETLDQIRSSLALDGNGLGTQLVTLFLAEAPGKLEALDRAAAGAPAGVLEGAAGDLKGMCGLVGAGPMADLCAALLDAGSGTGAAARVAAIRAEYERVRSTLEELVGATSA